MATLTEGRLSALFHELGLEAWPSLSPNTDINHNPVEIYIRHLAEILVQVTGCDPQVALESIQWPVEDWDLVVALPRLRLEDIDGDNPAADLKQRVRCDVYSTYVLEDSWLTLQFPPSSLFANPVDDGIQLRFLFAPITLARILLSYILDRGTLYGSVAEDEVVGVAPPYSTVKKKLVVDFSSPNLGKEFDGNYLRSTIIGNHIASLYHELGWDVCKMNFLGDWGRNIGLLAVGWLRFGSEELFKSDPLKHLVDVFSQIDTLSRTALAEEKRAITADKEAFFRRMEDRDQEAVELCRKFRDACLQQYEEQYARLNITFDDYSGESLVRPETIAEIETALRDRNAYRQSEGAWVIDYESLGYRGSTTSIARYSDGTTTYLLRDIAAAVERYNQFSFDKMIYVVTSRQDSHFREVIAALEIIGQSDLAAKLQHVSFGRLKGLSRPEGSNGLQLKDIIDQCQGTVGQFLEANPEDLEELRGDTTNDVSGSLAAVGLMAQELSIRRGTTFNFDLHKMGDMDSHSGLSLHYWFTQVDCRLQGVIIDRAELENADYTIFEGEAYFDTLRVLIQFPGMVKTSVKNLESSVIINYLYRLTDVLSTIFENEVEGVGESSQQNMAQLAFFECVRQTLSNGMAMLGMVPLRMQVFLHLVAVMLLTQCLLVGSQKVLI
ncbi:arginine-tRNA ligase [Exophiala spinifera]|uniref:arginine--tRNA ligase n=1 Tax=Exophiala spinifera TaxID=91928 RepID=A0A0D2BQ80_9EURO|nr:arginine-tRNA ligase [Exophiala spinifera]KIW20655.1 arginine-tRNA ligase [Exophiala spinifera]